MANLGADLGCKCVFMKPTKYIFHFSHFAQPKVFSVRLDIQLVAWIEKNLASNL
jgi:hypothetical protein